MKQIASFTVNHDVLKKGFYISRIDGDIATYDIRMAIPNSGAYLTNPAIHTFEHLFATYVRNSALTDSIVYVGPMGCRTGFYFLTRGITHQQALDLFRDTLEFISTFDAPIPGAQSSRECGNWLEHDLPAARDLAIDAVKQLSKDVGIPQDLKGILKEEDVQFLAESAYADACRPGNPRDTSVEEIAALYRSLM